MCLARMIIDYKIRSKSYRDASRTIMNTNSFARQPAAFFGHGSPMNTLQDNTHTRAWARFGQQCLAHRPTAILCISAHWYIRGTAVTAMAMPRTIHDFGGFPQALFDVEYPAPGAPALAQRVAELLAPLDVVQDQQWGLDHGTWSVLAHVFPEADIPVVQLSIDATQPPAFHYQLGQKLTTLRDEGVLIMGSGDTVHNLRTVRWGDNMPAYDWALRFDEKFKQCLVSGNHTPLINYDRLDPEALLSVPTPDHYLPILYALGAHRPDDQLQIITEGIELGSISMMAFAFK